MNQEMKNVADAILYTAMMHDKEQEELKNKAKEIIAMLNVLKENSYSGNPQVARNFTIIKDCKKDSFDFVIDQAIACLVR